MLDTAAAWLLHELPKKLAVIGAGASGTEIASAYGRLGTEVVLLEALPQILPLEDEDIAKAAAREIGKQMKIVTGANVEKVDVGEEGRDDRLGRGRAGVRLRRDRRRARARRRGARAGRRRHRGSTSAA